MNNEEWNSCIRVMLLLGVNTQVHASTTVCAFLTYWVNPGEAYKVMEEWALPLKHGVLMFV